MVKKSWTIAWVFMLFNGTIMAQSKPDYNPKYIETYPNSLYIAPYLETKSNVLRLDYQTLQGSRSLNYLSNFIVTSGFRFRYKWANLQVGAHLPSKRFNETLGTSKNFGIGLNIVQRRFNFYTKYETYEGFYLQNTDDWLGDYRNQNNQYYLRPDLTTKSLVTGVNFLLNSRRFSAPAAIFQFERQKKTALGFVVGVNHTFNRISADSSLVPTSNIDTLTRLSSTFLESHTLGLQCGLMLTVPLFHKKMWYITSSIIPGYSVQKVKTQINYVNLLDGNVYNGFTNEFRFGGGYNARRWFASAGLLSTGNTISLKDGQRFIVQNAYLRFSAGFRFGK
jgi:hypothetical protein